MWIKRILLIASLFLSVAGSAHAQAGGAAAKSDVNDAAEKYESSLQGLASLYEADLKRLTEQNAKIKDLFDKGLVSRLEVEQSDKALADARAKIEDVNRDIASAKAKPAAVVALPGLGSATASAAAWGTGNKQIDDLIRYYGGAYGVDPFLIYCVMNQESGFSAGAVSPKGAQGLMQLMPDTAARYGVTRLSDPSQNIMAGTRYLRDLQKMFGGRIDLVLAAYNAGEGAVMKYGNRIPPYQETQNYVRNIIAHYKSNWVSVPATKAAL